MKKTIAVILAALLALSAFGTALAQTYTDKATVKQVQQALNDAGYNCGTPDGAAGKKTKAAIKSYQTDKGLEATGGIDDALLESLGIDTAAPETVDGSDGAESGQADGGASHSAEDLRDPGVLSARYNELFLARLRDLGVNVDSEDIGQKEYLVSGLRKESFGYSLLAGNICIVLDIEESTLSLEERSGYSLERINYLDHAAAYAFYCVVNEFFQGSEEDLASVLELLGDAPEPDGEIAIDSLALYDEWPDDWPENDSYQFGVSGSNSSVGMWYYFRALPKEV